MMMMTMAAALTLGSARDHEQRRDQPKESSQPPRTLDHIVVVECLSVPSRQLEVRVGVKRYPPGVVQAAFVFVRELHKSAFSSFCCE